MASEVRFADVRRKLERVGYRLARINGSHHIFLKPGAAAVSIPVHKGKVRSVDARQVEKIAKESDS